jgi:GLPGLI family protein
VQKDSLNIFNWEIKEDTKTILGYSCQLAVVTLEEGLMKFWFTAALPDAGPWKFGNLPGLILAVKSKDDYVSWEALGIRIKTYPILKYPKILESDKALSCLSLRRYTKQKKPLQPVNSLHKRVLPIVTARMQIQRYIEEG